MSRFSSIFLLVICLVFFACEKETILEEQTSQAELAITTNSRTDGWHSGQQVSTGSGSAWAFGNADASAMGARVTTVWNDTMMLFPGTLNLPLLSSQGPFDKIELSNQPITLPGGGTSTGVAVEFFMAGQTSLVNDTFMIWKQAGVMQPGATTVNPGVYSTHTNSGKLRSIVVLVDAAVGNAGVGGLMQSYQLNPHPTALHLFGANPTLSIRKNGNTGVCTFMLSGLGD